LVIDLNFNFWKYAAMPISIDRALRHMAWANQKVYSAFEGLPDSALDAYIVNPEWDARQILQHIVASSDWYVYCLGISNWNDIPKPQTIADLPHLAATLAKYDAQILSAAELEDELLSFQDEVGSTEVLRSTLLAEAILHATEHRAQLMDAIESKGFFALTLDSIDLWAYESMERRNAL
jgi:uncharacterized damage-inducible protein DinB